MTPFWPNSPSWCGCCNSLQGLVTGAPPEVCPPDGLLETSALEGGWRFPSKIRGYFYDKSVIFMTSVVYSYYGAIPRPHVTGTAASFGVPSGNHARR